MKTEEIKNKISKMSGISNNQDFFVRLKRRLNGNIAMKGIDDFQLTQISWEAKDLVIEDILSLFRSSP